MGAKLTISQKDIIHKLFVKIDVNKDNRLSVREVADRFQIPYNKAHEFVAKNDKNNDNMLDEQEFTHVIEKHVLSVFRKFDKDGTGSISMEEAQKALDDLKIKGLDAKGFVERLGSSSNGQITFEDWLNGAYWGGFCGSPLTLRAGLFVELAINEKSLLD